MSDEFKLVKRRRNKQKPSLESYLRDLYISNSPTDYSITIRRIEEEKQDIVVSDKFLWIKRSLNANFLDSKATTIVCFGLGKFSECLVARCQFALLLALRDEFCKTVIVYDPNFTAADLDLLKHYNCDVLEENTEGKFHINDKPTIFYLPHCPKQLTNNLLYSNWNSNLQKCVLISNSFENTLLRTPIRLLKSTANYILKISPYVTETPLQLSTAYSNILNDTSIHTFHKTAPLPPEFWSNPKQPEYPEDDTEFVKKVSSDRQDNDCSRDSTANLA